MSSTFPGAKKSGDFFVDNAGELPDGVNDLTQAIRHEGQTGICEPGLMPGGPTYLTHILTENAGKFPQLVVESTTNNPVGTQLRTPSDQYSYLINPDTVPPAPIGSFALIREGAPVIPLQLVFPSSKNQLLRNFVGIDPLGGVIEPISTLDVNGSIAVGTQTVTGSTTLTAATPIHTLVVNNGATGCTITLPSASSVIRTNFGQSSGRIIVVKRANNTSTGTITINGNSGATGIESVTLFSFGATTSLGTTATSRAVTFQAINNQWHVIGN